MCERGSVTCAGIRNEILDLYFTFTVVLYAPLSTHSTQLTARLSSLPRPRRADTRHPPPALAASLLYVSNRNRNPNSEPKAVTLTLIVTPILTLALAPTLTP